MSGWPAGEAGPPTRVVGLGSSLGDDAVGWCAAALLAEGPLPAHVQVSCCAAPATELLPLLAGAGRVILLDAVAGAGVPGTLVHCAGAELQERGGGASSHGVPVTELLALAAVLGMLPPRVELWGVAIDADRPGCAAADPSPAVAAAVPELVRRVRDAIVRDGQSTGEGS